MAVKFSPSRTAEHIAVQYLKHEFRKILFEVRSPRVWGAIDRSLERVRKKYGEVSFWNLVAAIAEGWKLKHVFFVLSNTRYQFRLERIPMDRIVLTGMSPVIDKYIITEFRRDPMAFAHAWKANAAMRRDIMKTGGLGPYKERDHFPIFLVEAKDGFRVFDGMRRTLLSLTQGKKSIRAWVGREVNPKGRPLISNNRAWFLANIYEFASRKDRELGKAVVRFGREIVGSYRNGKESLEKRVAGWSHNPELKALFARIFH